MTEKKIAFRLCGYKVLLLYPDPIIKIIIEYQDGRRAEAIMNLSEDDLKKVARRIYESSRAVQRFVAEHEGKEFYFSEDFIIED